MAATSTANHSPLKPEPNKVTTAQPPMHKTREHYVPPTLHPLARAIWAALEAPQT